MSIEFLEQLEAAVGKSAGRFDELRERADRIYEDRVAQIAKSEGCGMVRAYALATQDDIASRAYTLSCDLAERQSRAESAGMSVAAFTD